MTPRGRAASNRLLPVSVDVGEVETEELVDLVEETVIDERRVCGTPDGERDSSASIGVVIDRHTRYPRGTREGKFELWAHSVVVGAAAGPRDLQGKGINVPGKKCNHPWT